MDDGQIWTDTRFHVIELEKSYLPERIVVRQPGGATRISIRTWKALWSFVPAKRLSVPVGKPGNRFNVVGWSQGTFRIRRDSHTGAEMVTQDSAEIPVYNPAAQGFTKTGVKNLQKDVFVQRVRREVLRPTRFTPSRWMAPPSEVSNALVRFAAMPRRIRDGRRCKVESCLALTPRSPRVRGLDFTIRNDRHSNDGGAAGAAGESLRPGPSYRNVAATARPWLRHAAIQLTKYLGNCGD